MKISVRFVAALCIVILTGCNHEPELTSNAFLEQAKGLEQLHSAKWTRFLGVRDGKAYLECGTLMTITGKPDIKIYWTEYAALPPEVRNKIDHHIEPWIISESYEEKHKSRAP